MPLIEESLKAARDINFTRDEWVQQMRYEKREVPLIEESLKAVRNRKFTRVEGVQQMRYEK